MNHDQSQSKVFLEIVEKIKKLIDENKWGPGDKIPSERELSETLNAGRSSVREALRSLELLGIIETRRGEGTYITDFRNHRLVEMIGSFVLQSDQAKKDVKHTIQLLEIASLLSIIDQKKKLPFSEWEKFEIIDIQDFFESIISKTDNYLLLKIWRILIKFENSIKIPKYKVEKKYFLELLQAVNHGDEKTAISLYKKIMKKMSNT